MAAAGEGCAGGAAPAHLFGNAGWEALRFEGGHAGAGGKEAAEVRDLLKAEGNNQGVLLSFCLEEVVWESKSKSKAALLKYHSTRGELKERKSKPGGKGKEAGRVGLEQGGAGAAVAVQAEEGGEGEEVEEEEEEAEAEGEDQGDHNGEGGSGLCGKRRSDVPEAGSASKRR